MKITECCINLNNQVFSFNLSAVFIFLSFGQLLAQPYKDDNRWQMLYFNDFNDWEQINDEFNVRDQWDHFGSSINIYSSKNVILQSNNVSDFLRIITRRDIVRCEEPYWQKWHCRNQWESDSTNYSNSTPYFISSGWIESKPDFAVKDGFIKYFDFSGEPLSFHHGYYELRARFTLAPYQNTAFWTLGIGNSDNNNANEIDVFETDGAYKPINATHIITNLHKEYFDFRDKFSCNKRGKAESGIIQNCKRTGLKKCSIDELGCEQRFLFGNQGWFTFDWHVYGLEWDSNFIKIYVDNELWTTYINPAMNKEVTLILNSAFLKSTGLSPLGLLAEFGEENRFFDVDYLKYYKKIEPIDFNPKAMQPISIDCLSMKSKEIGGNILQLEFSSDFLNLSRTNFFQLELYNIQGRLISKNYGNANGRSNLAFSINSSEIPSGIYLVVLKGNNKVFCNKKLAIIR